MSESGCCSSRRCHMQQCWSVWTLSFNSDLNSDLRAAVNHMLYEGGDRERFSLDKPKTKCSFWMLFRFFCYSSVLWFFSCRSSSKNYSLMQHFDISAFPVLALCKMCPTNKKEVNLEELTWLYVMQISCVFENRRTLCADSMVFESLSC